MKLLPSLRTLARLELQPATSKFVAEEGTAGTGFATLVLGPGPRHPVEAEVSRVKDASEEEGEE